MKLSLTVKKICPCLLSLILFFGSTESRGADFVLLKKGPAPEIIAVDGEAKLLYGEFIRRQLQKRYPTLETIIVGDKRYMFITEKWFRDVVDWTEHFIKQQGLELDTLEDLPTAYEETFTMLMSNIANIAVAKRYNVKGSVLIGLVVAKSEKPWGIIKADGKPRRYVIGLTEHGAIIYDIPTRQFIIGKEFPNLESITGMML